MKAPISGCNTVLATVTQWLEQAHTVQHVCVCAAKMSIRHAELVVE